MTIRSALTGDINTKLSNDFELRLLEGLPQSPIAAVEALFDRLFTMMTLTTIYCEIDQNDALIESDNRMGASYITVETFLRS